MNSIQIIDLQQKGSQIKTLQHEEVKDFLSTSLKEGINPIQKFFSVYFTAVGLAFCVNCGFNITKFITEKNIDFLVPICIGILFSFTLLIIIHELLHALAYYLVGGKNIYFGADIKKFVFYAASDKAVYNGRQFSIIALSPFIMINLICLIAYYINPASGSFCLTILFFHSLFCSGDFIFLNFVSNYKLEHFYTYDNRQEQKSYYYLMP